MVLPNRLAVPAMVTRLSGEDGLVNDDVIDRYERFAAGGAGLIVVEAASIHGGKSGPLLKVSDDSHIDGLARLVNRCHAAGDGKVFLQIIHFLKIARSGWRQTVADLSVEELEALPDLFAAAAQRAQAAGFDGVELHMAHAYTLSSMLSRYNRRRDHYGRTLENRLRLPSMVLARVMRAVSDYPIGVRLDADESIKRGYSVNDSAKFAIRFAELGAAYVSLSAGGKFEDAVHRQGTPLYPYTGYSGDRCMPGDSAPYAANIWMARHVRAALRAVGHDTPVLGTGKINTVELADELLADRACDIVGMARALLADPWLPAKTRAGRPDDTLGCIYCNVCKSLDERFKTVVCYLWPEGAVQAPDPAMVGPESPPPTWAEAEPLSVSAAAGEVRLRWSAADGDPIGYDVTRAVDDGAFTRLTSCSRERLLDDQALSGRRLAYRVVPYDAAGRRGQESNTVQVAMDDPLMTTAPSAAMDAGGEP